MATVLITGVGGACGIGAIRSLHERTGHEVVGVDMDPHAAGLYMADDGCPVPAADDDAWADEMRSIVRDHEVDVVVPTVDEELVELPALRERLPAGVRVIAPRGEVVDLALDKYCATKHLASAGHAVPRTWLATERDDVDEAAYPLLVKPRRGRGSRGIERVDSQAELAAHLAMTEYDPEALLLQEFVGGTEYTTSVVVTGDDRLLAVVPKEAIAKEGSTVTGVTRRAPSVSADCREIFETLSPAGPINVQQIVDADGIPHTIEINPRFSSTSCLTAAAGVDEFDLLIRDALGEAVSPPEDFLPEMYIRRYQDHVFVPADDFESRPQISPSESTE